MDLVLSMRDSFLRWSIQGMSSCLQNLMDLWSQYSLSLPLRKCLILHVVWFSIQSSILWTFESLQISPVWSRLRFFLNSHLWKWQNNEWHHVILSVQPLAYLNECSKESSFLNSSCTSVWMIFCVYMIFCVAFRVHNTCRNLSCKTSNPWRVLVQLFNRSFTHMSKTMVP